MTILGVDLAWGDRMADGVCTLAISEKSHAVTHLGVVHGDDALVEYILDRVKGSPALVLFDGPIVCPNTSGGRPVDRLTHSLFGRFHAGAHPANRSRCPRPPRIAERLLLSGCQIGWPHHPSVPYLVEVYPHPAMVRLFHLPQIVKYKRGPVAVRRAEFRRLRHLISDCAARRWSTLDLSLCSQLLQTPWTKVAEDQVDALFCALIGYHHWLHGGAFSEVLGDLESGFILVPTAGC
jgi:predicted RNase H-like nuclease